MASRDEHNRDDFRGASDLDRGQERPPDAADPSEDAEQSGQRIGSAGGGPYPPTTETERHVSQE